MLLGCSIAAGCTACRRNSSIPSCLASGSMSLLCQVQQYERSATCQQQHETFPMKSYVQAFGAGHNLWSLDISHTLIPLVARWQPCWAGLPWIAMGTAPKLPLALWKCSWLPSNTRSMRTPEKSSVASQMWNPPSRTLADQQPRSGLGQSAMPAAQICRLRCYQQLSSSQRCKAGP